MRITEIEKERVLNLDGTNRYKYFLKRVVNSEAAWGLWNEGWALMEDNEGNKVFPLWPAREYAEVCAQADWSTYKPEEIFLNDLIEELLPKLEKENIVAAVFPTPHGKGVTPAIAELKAALLREKRKY